MLILKKNQKFSKVDENTDRCVVTYGENIMSVLVRFKNTTKAVELHSHPEEQVTYILKGKLKFFEGTQEYLVEAGDVLKFAPNVPHGCIVLENESEVLDTFTPIRKDFL
ncbi:cupin domain-containing protein [Enterococcus massiliensis]|uniref:cupin domain-containing protein n=1 Tax=Enterococcus massiliensis TaxID=1640685 RepID=UPI00065E71ED|nr:cupin domain-containing protein [Enterococcus massiliensis]